MSKGKYLKKPKASKSKPRFTMTKNIKQKINVLLSVGMVLGGLYGTITDPLAVNAQENPHKISPKITPEFSKTETMYSIGIASHNASIEVDGQNIKIDPNSFIIVSDDGALAYDEYGNIFRGAIRDTDYKELLQLTEKEMSRFTVYQVVSDSDVNVRCSPEITTENKISTVPSLDYVLGYTAGTPEYDGEWISTLSINNNAIYDGYIREDLIREVDTFEAINTRAEENFQNAEELMMVDTSQADYVDLKLRSLPETGNTQNIIVTLPYGTVVKVIGETIKSDNRNWSYIVYENSEGNIIQGWVASSYLTSDIVYQPQIKINASGSVTGIDVSSMSPNDLRTLLENGIPDTVKTTIRKC